MRTNSMEFASSSGVSSVTSGKSSSMRAIISLYWLFDSRCFILSYFIYCLIPKFSSAAAGDVFDGFDDKCC